MNTMKKKLRLILCCLLLGVSLAGCGGKDEESIKEIIIGDRTFIEIYDEFTTNFGECRILVDKETKVQYLRDSGYQQGGLEVIVDADGKPILYEGEL